MNAHAVAKRLVDSPIIASVHRARSFHSERDASQKPTPDLSITTHAEFPDVPSHVSRRLMIEDATQVVEALYTSLPQGTLDQILRLLLERMASQLVTRAPQPEI